MTFLINIFFWLLSGLLKYQSSTEQSPPPSSPLFPCQALWFSPYYQEWFYS
ncbi:MAG: hypothetical protein ACKPGW_12095 [Microcystis panniformis]